MVRRSFIAVVLIIAMTACGGGGGRNAVPPEGPVQQPTLPSMEPAAGTLTQTVHYLDNTGCQDFAKYDFFNRRIDRALVSPYSAGKIRYAFSRYPYAPVFNAPYRYEVVAAGAPLYPVASRSAHRIPANIQNPHVTGWPVPANMAALLSTADRVSILVQQIAPPRCRGWEGYAFAGSGTRYSAYSGDHVDMGYAMAPETCNGVASLCGEDLEGNLTYYELNANTGNAAGVVTHPIVHAIRSEFPCALAGTCGWSTAYSFNNHFNCRTTCGRLRLRAALVARPRDPNAAALYDAMVHYGLDTSENGCCWGFYTMIRANAAGYPATIPPAASAFIRSLRISNFELVTSGTW